MSGEPTDLAQRALERRKREDAALAVPVVGTLLLVSPVLNVFVGGTGLFGLPAAYLWVFAVWAGLILLTRTLSARLMGDGDRS